MFASSCLAVQGAEGALVAGRGAGGGGDSEASAGGRGEDQTPGTGYLQVSNPVLLTAVHLLRNHHPSHGGTLVRSCSGSPGPEEKRAALCAV